MRLKSPIRNLDLDLWKIKLRKSFILTPIFKKLHQDLKKYYLIKKVNLGIKKSRRLAKTIKSSFSLTAPPYLGLGRYLTFSHLSKTLQNKTSLLDIIAKTLSIADSHFQPSDQVTPLPYNHHQTLTNPKTSPHPRKLQAFRLFLTSVKLPLSLIYHCKTERDSLFFVNRKRLAHTLNFHITPTSSIK